MGEAGLEPGSWLGVRERWGLGSGYEVWLGVEGPWSRIVVRDQGVMGLGAWVGAMKFGSGLRAMELGSCSGVGEL